MLYLGASSPLFVITDAELVPVSLAVVLGRTSGSLSKNIKKFFEISLDLSSPM